MTSNTGSCDPHIIGVDQFADKVKVLGAVDVSVPHELEIVFVHLVLDGSWHRVVKEMPLFSLLHQRLQGDRRGERDRQRMKPASYKVYCK